jgi:hypothetical protein
LSKADVTTLAQRISSEPLDKVQMDLQAIARGAAGNEKAYGSIMNQLAPKAPMFAAAGQMSVRKGTVSVGGTAMDGQTVGAHILAGEHILQGRMVGSKEVAPRAFQLPNEADLQMAYRQAVPMDAVWSANPEQAAKADSRTYQAAKFFAVSKAYADKRDPKSIGAREMAEAVDAVTGGVSTVNGAQIVRPWGVGDRQFTREAPHRMQAAIDGAGYQGTSLNLVRSYRLYQISEGVYGLSNKSSVLRDKRTGAPVRVDFNQPLSADAQEKQRASDAFYDMIKLGPL